MSLCFSLLSKNTLIMAGDSRESIKINGEHFSTGRNIHKIKQVGDKVIFMGGSAEVTSRIVRDFEKSDDQSISHLQTLTLSHKERFIRKYGPEYLGSTAHAIFLVGAFEEGSAVLYGINSKDDCRITRRHGGYGLETAIIGPSGMNDRAYGLYNEYKQAGGNDVLEMYQHVYDSVSNEEIGGEMRVFFLTPTGIEECTLPIKDHREIRTADIYNRSYNSDELTFYANGSKALWFDLPRRKFIFGGDLEAAGGTFSGTLRGADGKFTGTIEGGSFIGGSIQIGSSFNVNNAGHMKAVGAEFSGDISASVISGGQITGTSISGVTVTGSTVSTRNGNSRGIVMNSGWSDLEIYSGYPGVIGVQKIFAIEDLVQDAGLWFNRDASIIAGRDIRISANDEVRITAPGGLFVNGVQIG